MEINQLKDKIQEAEDKISQFVYEELTKLSNETGLPISRIWVNLTDIKDFTESENKLVLVSTEITLDL